MSLTDNAHLRGYNARIKGKRLSENPYTSLDAVSCVMNDCWRQGWNDRKEYESTGEPQ